MDKGIQVHGHEPLDGLSPQGGGGNVPIFFTLTKSTIHVYAIIGTIKKHSLHLWGGGGFGLMWTKGRVPKKWSFYGL